MPEENYSVKRRIKYLKLRRKARRGEIFIRRVFKVLRFCLIVLIVYGVYLLSDAKYWYLPEDIFSAGNNIEFSGNSIVSDKKMLNELKKVQLEKAPIYRINPDKISRAIEALPPVKRAYTRRLWMPARLFIAVEEVIPAVIISPYEDTPEIAAFSFDGTFISREYLPLANRKNIVKVLSFGTKDDDYEKWDKKKVNLLYRLADEIEYYSGEKVKYIDLRIPNNAFVQLDSFKIRLGVLDLNVFERIKAISSMLSSNDIKRLAPQTRYIDLSWSQVQYINIEENTEEETQETPEAEAGN